MAGLGPLVHPGSICPYSWDFTLEPLYWANVGPVEAMESHLSAYGSSHCSKCISGLRAVSKSLSCLYWRWRQSLYHRNLAVVGYAWDLSWFILDLAFFPLAAQRSFVSAVGTYPGRSPASGGVAVGL